MLKQQAKFITKITIFADGMILLISMSLAYQVRNQWGGLKPFYDYIWIVFFAFFFWLLLCSRQGLYASTRRRSMFSIVTALANVHLLGGAILGGVIYLVDPRGFSRGLYLGFLGFSFLLMTLERVASRFILGIFRRYGYNSRNILIVGCQEKAQQFFERLTEHADWGLKVLGFVQVDKSLILKELIGTPVLGNVEELIKICKDYPVDEVIFCPPKSFLADVEDYYYDLLEIGITTHMVIDFVDLSNSRQELSIFDNEVPLLTYHSKSFDTQQLFLKRGLDICGSLVGLSITAILLPFIMCAIKLDSPGPVFFHQARVGASGRTFNFWKFRTMRADAEEYKQNLMALNEMNGAIFKIKDDPRITRVGNFLRKTSLDELPQFWNVLKGEMSLVGTRPPTPDEVAQYENWHRRRISIKHGITGLWQVSGRNQIINFDDIVKLDLTYIDSWSLWLDCKILCKTIIVVLTKSGSY